MLERRKDRVDAGAFGVSRTAPIMKRPREPTTKGKRERSKSVKRAKVTAKKPTLTKAKGTGLLKPKKRKTDCHFCL